ncbi:hypothetical protein HPP92_028651 [Vanilla planifolia]|uniref:Uncharacterized protein n=1 Tax=Vanilla planifolia TaxID=51239 RepID=A0A835PAC7_VANPL|nr:hypothetical protein HPP92_028651 [Vanilla planifolia]KAG0446877.1 hypothetical protein HPP92_028644 [Vanilla planifolia]
MAYVGPVQLTTVAAVPLLRTSTPANVADADRKSNAAKASRKNRSRRRRSSGSSAVVRA